MSLKTGAEGRRPLSLALRLTIWYALSAFALIAASTAVLYQLVEASEIREDADFLNQYFDSLRLVMPGAPPPATRGGRLVFVRVMDDGRRTLTETPGMAAEVPPPSADAVRSLGATSQALTEVVSKSGEPFQSVVGWSTARPGESRRLVQIAVDRAAEERRSRSYRDRLWMILAVSLVGCATLGLVIAGLGLRPIRRIGDAAGRIGQTTLHERIATDGLPAELQGLAAAFNTMLARLQEAFTRTARFSDDVAHELRTPIGNLRGEIEVALSRPRSDEDYRETLGSCLEECGRISRMVERLLFLARTDAAVEPLAREPMEIAHELGAVHEFYEAAAADAGVRLELAVPPGLTAPLDRTLFQQAVGNLVSNAVAHTPPGGRVRLAAESKDAAVHISVCDTGRGIEPEHLPHVFDRFYRVDRARTGVNAGLGLAVVKSIVERHGGHANIQSRPGEGTTVELVFPHA